MIRLQQLLLGLSGSSTLPGSLDITSNEAMSRRLVSSGTSTSTTQSPGLNLSSHPPTEDESLSPSYAASSILELKEAISGNNARNTIPIHCVIERSNPALLSPGTSGPSTGSQPPTSQCSTTSPPLIPSTSSATDLSMAMVGSSSTVVGSTSSSSGSGSSNPNSPTVIEQDTYAILSASIPLNDIVRSVLTKLGYAPQEMVGAKAFVQLRNWKPLTLDQISESVEATIGDIFSDIASFITLRIRLFRELGHIQWTHLAVREAILNLLRELSQSKLSKLCKISQPIISNIVNSKEFKLSQSKCEEFGQWYLQYQRSTNQSSTVPQAEAGTSSSAEDKADKTASEARLTFHPKQEVPRLVEWFQSNRNPSDRILSYFADLLNQSPLRVERNKVTVKSLKNWWKNYKQKQRNEQKGKTKPTKDTKQN